MTAEAIQGVQAWLDDLSYPHLSSPEAVARLVQGDFGQSLVYLSSVAVGRQRTAHIKRELYELREEASRRLSVPRREELGLDRWEKALKDVSRLRNEEMRSSDELAEAMEGDRTAERINGSALEETLHKQSLRYDLQQIADMADYQEKRIARLGALVDEWRSSFERSLNQSTAPVEVRSTLQRLRDPFPDQLPSSPAASPIFLTDLVNKLSHNQSQLRDHVVRHSKIRPPRIDVLEEILHSLRSCAINLAEKNALSPPPGEIALLSKGDERQDLINAISSSRRRRAAVELLTKQSVKAPISRQSQGDLDELIARQERHRLSIEALLDLCSSLCRDIETLSTSPNPLASLDDLHSQRDSTLAHLAILKPSALSSYDASVLLASQPPPSIHSLPDSLSQDLQRALKTHHLLATQPLLRPYLTKKELEAAFDGIASERFGAEALSPALEGQLSSGFEVKVLEDAVNYRTALLEGKFLPSTSKGEDGKTLSERWKKLERRTK